MSQTKKNWITNSGIKKIYQQFMTGHERKSPEWLLHQEGRFFTHHEMNDKNNNNNHNNNHTANKFKKKLSSHTKEYSILLLVFLTLHFITLCIGSLIFYYIEHCSSEQENHSEKSSATTSIHSDLCHQLLENGTRIIKDEDEVLRNSIIKACDLNNMNSIHGEANVGECSRMTWKTFRSWFHYCYSISFTLGMEDSG